MKIIRVPIIAAAARLGETAAVAITTAKGITTTPGTTAGGTTAGGIAEVSPVAGTAVVGTAVGINPEYSPRSSIRVCLDREKRSWPGKMRVSKPFTR
jgi:hypothetical protein